MRLDASTAEIISFLQEHGYHVHYPVDAQIGDEQARVALKGNQHVIVRRTGNGLHAEYDAGDRFREEVQETRIVAITVEGGVIQDVVCPKGVKVIVRDYDSEGVEAESLKQDDNGDDYIESIWE